MPKNFQPLVDELRTIIENSRSGRLSTTEEQRGASLFKELILSTLQSARKENAFEPRDRQIVFSVLVGKSKPWLLQLDLAALKPAEAQLVALSAIECSIGTNPPSVVAIIQWAKPFQPLATV